MNKILCAAIIMLFMSCTENKRSSTDDPYLVKSESFQTEMGDKSVYGVHLYLHSPHDKKEFRAYRVSLYQDEKVWIDTMYAELSPGDTLEGEIIFSEATVKEGSAVSFKTEAFDIK